MSTALQLLLASANDMDYLLDLRKSTMVEHLAKSGIVYSDEQHRARILEHFDCFYLILLDGVCVGAIKYSTDNNRIKIMQLQIHPDFQNQGIGAQVIRQILVEHAHLDCYLTVLKFNPAKDLYLRLGFIQYGEDELEFHMRYGR